MNGSGIRFKDHAIGRAQRVNVLACYSTAAQSDEIESSEARPVEAFVEPKYYEEAA